MLLVRFYYPDLGNRLGVEIDGKVYDVSASVGSVTNWLRSSMGRVDEAIEALRAAALNAEDQFAASAFENPPSSEHPHWLAPVDEQDIWASGVTYERSREARQEEAIDGGD